VALATAFVDGLLAAALGTAGVWAAAVSSRGVGRAAAREEFAIGMFLGALAWGTWIVAFLVAVMAFISWRVYRRVGRAGSSQFIDLVGLTLALVPVAIVLAFMGYQITLR